MTITREQAIRFICLVYLEAMYDNGWPIANGIVFHEQRHEQDKQSLRCNRCYNEVTPSDILKALGVTEEEIENAANR